ncbi:hypothetical protein [Bacillus massiliigorillae]|uniref:hypothetical protein n=1 Tax=Bacillus massiliigorillae TaxID=1243664 RepID=UPI0003A84955|nr:hypothetical protein [Bacillus massiliigorillae]
MPIGNNLCEIVELYPNGWAKNNNITNNDIIYCKKDIDDPVFKLEKTHEILLYENDKIFSRNVSYQGFPDRIIILNFVYIIYFCISFAIAIILYLKKRENKQYRIISFLIVLIGISFLSSVVSARGDVIGVFITSLSLWLIPLQLIDYINTMIPKEKKLYKFELFYVLIFIIAIVNLFFVSDVVIIFIFLLLLLLLIIYFYQKYKFIKRDINYIKLKMLFWTIIISLLPFIF